ncbi:hypothetical protein IGL98_001398 [Enterococcus sp. DIV0840]|uniref:DUF6287 domain-containing protein n=1 Tax=unclassified Enterococcus TaxID=2608891 RepID=UPI001A90A757|nr:DUF6287 domain-containing protein [Enterococcus sp. DIV0849a]MBO0434898.1 hypothetical protein [Enterococcus sp. DIV0849a]
MKWKISGCILIVLLILVSCKNVKDSSKELSTQSTSTTKPIINNSTTTKSSEAIQINSSTEQNPYGLEAPNDIYTHLIVTNAKGNKYLRDNGYYTVIKTDTTNPDQSFVSEYSALLPNVNDAYGGETYMYFWCNSEMKRVLKDVWIDDTIIFFEANEDYLNQLENAQTPSASLQGDLDIEAINNGDINSLVGTWQNGTGDILVINADGTTNRRQTVHTIKDSDKISKIPYASLSTGEIGGSIPLGLFKAGFENPDGDNSDATKARLILAQQGGAYPAESYYYRQ